MKIKAYRCDECDTLFEELGGRLFECGSCGDTYPEDETEDRRCPQCHRFAAKAADASCPECNADASESVQELEAWRGRDGDLYASEQAEREWIDGAEDRERRAEESRAFVEGFSRARRAECAARNAKLLPELRRLLELLAGRAPKLAETVRWNAEMIELDPETGGDVLGNLWLTDLAPLLASDVPGWNSTAASLIDFDIPYAEREALAEPFLDAIRARITEPPELVERLDSIGLGSAPSVPLRFVAPGLIAAINARGKP